MKDQERTLLRRLEAWAAVPLIGLSRVHLRQGDPTAGAKVREKLEGMLRDLPAGEIAGKVLLHLAEAAQRQGQMQQRHAFLQRALEQFKASDDRQGLSDTLVELGNALMAPAENTPEHRVSAGERYAAVYEINLSRCIFCGYCEVACPFDAITMGNDFELSDYNRSDLIFTKEMLLAEPLERAPLRAAGE